MDENMNNVNPELDANVDANADPAQENTGIEGEKKVDVSELQVENAAMKAQIEKIIAENAKTAASLKKAEEAISKSKQAEKERELAAMTDEQRKAAEREAFEEELRQGRIELNTEFAKALLTTIDDSMSDEEISLFVSDDKSQTVALCECFKKYVNKIADAREKIAREEEIKKAPQGPVGDGSDNSSDSEYEAKMMEALGL